MDGAGASRPEYMRLARSDQVILPRRGTVAGDTVLHVPGGMAPQSRGLGLSFSTTTAWWDCRGLVPQLAWWAATRGRLDDGQGGSVMEVSP